MKGPICALGSGDADHREKVTTKAHPPQLLSPRPSGGLDGWAVEGYLWRTKVCSRGCRLSGQAWAPKSPLSDRVPCFSGLYLGRPWLLTDSAALPRGWTAAGREVPDGL